MERNRRTSLQGVVTSTKMNKTIVVEVETHKRHPKYAKRVKYSSKYYAHDERNEASVGDVVTIMGCRPLSATKRFRLVSIDQKAVATVKAVLEAEKAMEEQAETKAPEVKVETPVVEEAKVEKVEEKAEEVEVTTKKPAAKKTTAKKATSTAAKKPAAKKAPAKKAAAKAE